jgi:hypothetical protein
MTNAENLGILVPLFETIGIVGKNIPEVVR